MISLCLLNRTAAKQNFHKMTIPDNESDFEQQFFYKTYAFIFIDLIYWMIIVSLFETVIVEYNRRIAILLIVISILYVIYLICKFLIRREPSLVIDQDYIMMRSDLLFFNRKYLIQDLSINEGSVSYLNAKSLFFKKRDIISISEYVNGKEIITELLNQKVKLNY